MSTPQPEPQLPPASGGPGAPRTGILASLRSLARAWFELTVEEQRAAAFIIGLLLLGIAVRYWHVML